jgi:isopenicillin N synthase-like dioxygenase
MRSIPVVDLRAFTHGDAASQEDFVARFGAGLAEFGFVTLDHHGVSPDLIRRAFDVTARLFALPRAALDRCVVPASKGNRGYVAFGRERAVGAPLADLKEFWHVGQETIRPEHAGVYDPNVWPDDPSVADFREVSVAFYRALESVALVGLRAVARYLRLPDDHFASMAVDGNSILRLIHYPPVPADVPAGAVRAAAHEDINLMTLLVESTTGGLELQTRDGTWIPVHSLAGQIVLDAGDMLQRATNGLIPATTHRVVNPSGPNVTRYSLPFFTHPRPEVVLAPAATTVAPDRPARYAPITAQAFLEERLRAITA